MLSPIERLPEGLPDWFARNDVNGDGQISMSEYAHTWTSSKAAEFARYDLNSDGIITPEECLKVEKK
jgi:Ca2+-binding EF-hand superfamily protein